MAYDVIGNELQINAVLSALSDEIDFVESFINGLYKTLLDAANDWQGSSYDGYASMMGSYSKYFFDYLELISTYYDTLSGDATKAIELLETDVKNAMKLGS